MSAGTTSKTKNANTQTAIPEGDANLGSTSDGSGLVPFAGGLLSLDSALSLGGCSMQRLVPRSSSIKQQRKNCRLSLSQYAGNSRTPNTRPGRRKSQCVASSNRRLLTRKAPNGAERKQLGRIKRLVGRYSVFQELLFRTCVWLKQAERIARGIDEVTMPADTRHCELL
jgi:hypothetical protein